MVKSSVHSRRITDRFEIRDPEKDLLGRGSMGDVYRATDTHSGELVAVKALDPGVVARDPGIVERFAREGEALRQLDHPNIVRMVAAVEEEDATTGVVGHYLVVEYVAGGSLQDLLEAQGALPVSRVLEIALDLADALTRAHRLGIIHRDLKPENVLLAEDGTPRLTDFGIARVLESPRLTEMGVLMGTPDFLSPEACSGQALDERTDIWAFGVLLFEMLTGGTPFPGDTLTTKLTAILTQPVPDLALRCPDAPQALVDLISRMLEKDREQRIPSVRLVGAELEAILRGWKDLTTARPAPTETGFTPPLHLTQPPSFLEGEEPEERPVFVARERELAQLDRHLDRALSGQGRVVFVIGEAGQGKTALVAEFARRAQEAHPDLVVAGGNCNAHTGIGDPYLPFREILALLTGDVQDRWAARAISQEQARRLWQALPLTVQALVEAGPDLIDLFVPGLALTNRAQAFTPWPGRADGLPRLQELVQRKAAVPVDPNLEQSALFEQYTRVVGALAGQRPLLLMLDDLQWVDGGSTNLLFHLGRRIQGSRILIVGAYRPAEVALGRLSTSFSAALRTGSGERERHPLEPVVHELTRQFGDIEIDLGQAEDRQFVEALLDSEPNRLGDAFRETLYRQTRGHPLSTVELLRGMQERGDLVQDGEGRWVEGQALDWEALPARVEAVIAERISRLAGPARELLRVASVEGETFTAEVAARVLGADGREVVRQLGKLERDHRLVNAQGIRRLDPARNGGKGAQRLSFYRFRHVLFQRYLYDSLDEAERGYLHEDVGTALEAVYGEGAGEIAVSLARHFQEAGIAEKAVTYLLQAGEKAKRSSANEAAIAHFRRALELLHTTTETPERKRRELDLTLALGVPLVLTKGHAASEVEAVYTRAQALSAQVGDSTQQFQALMGLRRFFLHRAELQTAHNLGEQLLVLAHSSRDPSPVSRAHFMHAETLYRMGDFTRAQDHFQQALASYDVQQHHSYMFVYGNDTVVLCQAFLALTLWHLGYPDQALRVSLKGLSRAQELSHPFTHACALYFTAALHRLRRERAAVQALLEPLLQLCQDRGFVFYSALGTALWGWTLAEQGDVEQGIEQVEQGLATWRATGAGLLLPDLLACLAEARGKAGQVERGTALLTEALVLVDSNRERCWEAELYRLKGELLLKTGQEAEAEECFRHALRVASQQAAKAWELRAAMSLSHLLQTQGRGKEARNLLQEIYGWFTEGLDTTDLKEARALLKALN